jgi:hypothetical protein
MRFRSATSFANDFYFLRGLDPAIIYAIGIAELMLLLGFVICFATRVTYGLVLLLRAVSPLPPKWEQAPGSP